jgi:energy-coupling factor transporter ATP-binding protein EcfA2
MKYYNKKIDKSLLKEGFTIPIEFVNDFLSISKENSDINEENSVNSHKLVKFIMNDQEFFLPLKKVSGQRELLYQVRYTPTHPFAIELNKLFKANYSESSDSTSFETTEEYLELSIDSNNSLIGCKSYNREAIEKWQELLAYLGPDDSINLNDYKKSYKLIWINSVLNLMKTNDNISFENLVNEAYKIYMDLYSSGYPVEDVLKSNNNSEISPSNVKTIMTDAPMVAFGQSGLFYVDRGRKSISVSKELLNAFTNKNITFLNSLIDKKIDLYFNTRTNTKSNFSENMQYVLDNYEAAIKQPFANHQMGSVVRHLVVDDLAQIIQNNKYKIVGSIGQGNWAQVPWIAIMDKNETITTQNGIYLVYLINKATKVVYLSLAFGVTEFSRNMSSKQFMQEMKSTVSRFRSKLNIDLNGLQIDLGSSKLGKMYALGSVWYKSYTYSDLEDDYIIQKDLSEALILYDKALAIKNGELNMVKTHDPQTITDLNISDNLLEWTNNLQEYLLSKSLNYSIDSLKSIVLSMKTKPLVLLAGLSGTGKSKIVEGIANALGATVENRRFKLISVRPDWSDPSDLLGYVGLNDKFNPGPFAEFLLHANNTTEPCILCLDEMNLARVEHYFSDVLSLIETRKRIEGTVHTELIFSDEIFKSDNVSRHAYSKLRITDNIFIFGTVNMDDSTHPFSNKVLDRANTIEFNHIDLRILPSSDFDSDYQMPRLKTSLIKSDYIRLDECLINDGNKNLANQVIEVLIGINELLKSQNLQFGYRVRDEIIYFVTQAINHNMMSFEEAIDFCVFQKILPKFKGSSYQLKELIIDFFEYCYGKKFSHENVEGYNYLKMQLEIQKDYARFPVTTQKIVDIMKSYEVEGYATFWS